MVGTATFHLLWYLVSQLQWHSPKCFMLMMWSQWNSCWNELVPQAELKTYYMSVPRLALEKEKKIVMNLRCTFLWETLAATHRLEMLHNRELQHNYWHNNFYFFNLRARGCRHSSKDSSAPPILPPRVWVPSTPSMLFQFILFKLYCIFVICLECETNENKQKETEIGPFFNLRGFIRWAPSCFSTMSSCFTEPTFQVQN